MRFGYRIFFYSFLLLTAHTAHGAVVINEIAWMGGMNSANHEWIELHNTENNPVSLEGWVLSDGGGLNIELTGSLPASGYGVLERTSDGSAIGPAFLIYTGALVNTGATLTLRDASGQIMDQVAGGENWESVGGDNANKDTAQLTPSGWVTDARTPGRKNNPGRVEVEDDTKETESPVEKTNSADNGKSTFKPVVKSSKKNVETVRMVEPNTVLKLTPDIQTVAYVNQTIPFRVTGSGISEVITKSLQYEWNFGDTNTAKGQNVEHAYTYPGTYVVTVRGAYARHDQVARHEITILPVTFSITKNENGDVQINNDSPYDVDISGYVVRGVKSVTFPPRSVILPKATVTIPKNKLGGNDNSMLAIYDTKKNLVSSTYDNQSFISTLAIDKSENFPLVSMNATESATQKITPTAVSSIRNVPKTISAKQTKKETKPKFTFANVVEASEDEISEANEFNQDNEPEELTVATTNSLTNFAENTVNSNQSSIPKEKWPYLAFALLLFFAMFGLFWSKRI